jgi:hypothetical protein
MVKERADTAARVSRHRKTPAQRDSVTVTSPLPSRVDLDLEREEDKEQDQDQENMSDSCESCADISGDFERWWKHYGRIGSKADALVCYTHGRTAWASAEALTLAATRYLTPCRQTQTKNQARRDVHRLFGTVSFSQSNRWQEWL